MCGSLLCLRPPTAETRTTFFCPTCPYIYPIPDGVEIIDECLNLPRERPSLEIRYADSYCNTCGMKVEGFDSTYDRGCQGCWRIYEANKETAEAAKKEIAEKEREKAFSLFLKESSLSREQNSSLNSDTQVDPRKEWEGLTDVEKSFWLKKVAEDPSDEDD